MMKKDGLNSYERDRLMREILRHSNRDRKFLDLAFKVADLSTCTQKHGAVLVKGGRVLALGVNKDRNDPSVVVSDTGSEARGTIFSVHAEADALSRVKDATGAIVYVARKARTGREAFSRPCELCTLKLIEAGVKSICYTL